MTMRGQWVAALILLLLFGIASAPRPQLSILPADYEWPENAVQILRSRYEDGPSHHYSEEEADNFLANSLLHYTQLAQARRTKEQFRPENVREKKAKSSTFMHRHRLVIEGLDSKGNQRRGTPSWFSLPLMVDRQGLHYLHDQLPDGRLERSLDLIRFDRYKTRKIDGFWLPTAIVRPRYRRGGPANVKFTVVHEFPTSGNKFRSLYLVNPDGAASALSQALQDKESIWLKKVSPDDHTIISRLWGKAVNSLFLLDSPFFSNQERAQFSSKERNQNVASTIAPGSSAHPRSRNDGHFGASSSSEEEEHPVLRGTPVNVNQNRHAVDVVPGPAHDSPHIVQNVPNTYHEPNTYQWPTSSYEHGPHYQKWIASQGAANSAQGASSSSSAAPVPGRPQLVEHDFLTQRHDPGPIQPIRPRPLYPGQQRLQPSPQQNQPDQVPSYLRSLERDSNVDLDLSL
ncbi:uncharacterized protein SRS1_13496 [Sporisorium reilianum f. sp. reilianum]|uniref:Effector family protein Eff1 n=1 Tax=Sporisorium reilianum f. sp. reilianum TaxID=72559 RepID=A0A2N8UMC6_9BASI|nr:uncharacterized protein SRS1_13496 [Sporisorium reilianum f. sp. reilianum]